MADRATETDRPRRLFEPPKAPATPTPPLWRAAIPCVAALVLIDLVLSVWISLNAPSWRPLLSFGNVLIVGLSTILGLLPKEASEQLGARIQDWIVGVLASRLTRKVLVVVTALLVVMSAIRVALLVKSDGSGVATLHVVQGTQSQTPGNRVEIGTLALSRANPSREMRRFAWPVGNTIWGYTATHVTKRDDQLRPWRPVTWTYPEDFDEMVTLYVLPMTSASASLHIETPALVVSDAESVELFHAPLQAQGVKASYVFRDSTVGDGQTLTNEWTSAYKALDNRDSVAIGKRVKEWLHADTVRPRRPLHLHERIFYEIRFSDNQRRGPFALELVRNPLSVYIDSSKVDRPAAPPL